jgi:hypothetical protein
MTEKEQAEVRKIQADTDAIYIDTGVVAEDEITYSRFGGGEYSTDTILDLEKRNADKLAEDEEPDEPPPPPTFPGMMPPGEQPGTMMIAPPTSGTVPPEGEPEPEPEDDPDNEE